MIRQLGMPAKNKLPPGDLFVKLEIVYPIAQFLNSKLLQNIKPSDEPVVAQTEERSGNPTSPDTR